MRSRYRAQAGLELIILSLSSACIFGVHHVFLSLLFLREVARVICFLRILLLTQKGIIPFFKVFDFYNSDKERKKFEIILGKHVTIGG